MPRTHSLLIVLSVVVSIGASADSRALGRHRSKQLATAPYEVRLTANTAGYRMRMGTGVTISHQFQRQMGPPVAVDGSKTPELISDELAYRHFIRAVAISNVSASEVARRDGILRKLSLSDSDRASFISVLTDVGVVLGTVEQEKTQMIGPNATEAALVASNEREKNICERARESLGAVLTPEGWSSVDAYVRGSVKRAIVIYGDVQ